MKTKDPSESCFHFHQCLVVALLMLGLSAVQAQPSNDDCVGAIVATTIPFSVNATTIGTTASSGVADPACANYQGGDVWFEVDVLPGEVYTISTHRDPGSPITDLGMEIYDGSCGSLIQLDCDDDSGDGLFSEIEFTPANTTTIYIRLWEYGNDVAGTFYLNITVVPPPSNDQCSAAEILIHGPSCQTVSGTSQFATESDQSCIGFANDDVWYGFRATTTSAQIQVQGNGSYDPVLQFYNTCSTSGPCVNSTGDGGAEFYLATGLTIGQYYYYRVYDYGAVNNPPGNWTFSTCISGGAPPPSNDDCPNPIPIPVSNTTTCATTVSANLLGATPSNQIVSCLSQSYFADDVWFSFVATNLSHIVNIDDSGGQFSPFVVQITEGFCIMNPSEIACSDERRFLVEGLIIGQTYFVRVASLNTYYISFDICIQTPPPPPLNDNCSNPTMVPVSPTTECVNQISGSIAGATPSIQGFCAPEVFNDDVWFVFTALSSSHIIEISNFQGDTVLPAIQVTEGVCSLNPAELICTAESIFRIDGLVADQNYFIRVASNSTNYQEFTFDLCVRSVPPPPINDECPNALFISISGANCGSLISGSTSGATASTENSSCGFSDGFDDDVWFYFQASGTSQMLEIFNVSDSSQLLAFEVFTGTCTALTSLHCYDFPNNRFEIDGLQAGSLYYLRIASYTTSYEEVSFDICIRNPISAVNDECAGSIQLPVTTNSSCTSQINGDFRDATTSINDPNCEFIQDVWYFFIAQENTHTIHIEGLEFENVALAYQLLTGNCSAMTSLVCNTVSSSTGVTEIEFQNLMPSGVYFLKLGHLDFSFLNSTSFVFSDFTICVKGEEPVCTNVVSTTAASGPGSLRAAIECADVGEEITFNPVLNGQTIELDLPEIIIDKQLKFLADIADDISISNFNVNNTSRLLYIENALTIEGLKIEGKSASSMLWEIASGGNLDVIDGELILVTVEN